MSSKEAVLIFPHQLFRTHPASSKNRLHILIEQDLFFSQYPFHKKKLILHRASMKYYESALKKKGCKTLYLENKDAKSLKNNLAKVESVHYGRLYDNYLEKWLSKQTKGKEITVYETDYFFSDFNWITDQLEGKKSYFLTSFYKQVRKETGILMKSGKPEGGKWTYDSENRKSLPKNYEDPAPYEAKSSDFTKEATKYVEKYFSENPGNPDNFFYPVTHAQAKASLKFFLENRFSDFGDYQDAFGPDHTFLQHSLLSPALNTGLITPREVVEEALSCNAPLNCTEGFIRQIIGWRDFFGGIYELEGTRQRNSNFFNHKREIPDSFYDGTTGIPPVDCAIKRALDTGYTHHIERLMVLGNFMALCEFDPDEIYRWFMELFIDSYDWVMVPNVYGMSQYADGGLITTKPYISSSNYVRKMSTYKKGEWCDIWDGLYWRFIEKHKEFFASNPRLSMMARQVEKMDPDKLDNHKKNAANYLRSISR